MTCPKCDDTGWYQYDEWKSFRCGVCCRHAKGLWYLLEGYYGDMDGMWCCLSGCGKMWVSPRDYVKEMMT